MIPPTSTKQIRRLEVLMSWWGMSGLSICEDQSIEEKFNLIAEAGYDGINGLLPQENEARQWLHLLQKYNLSFSLNAYPKTVDDLELFLKKTKEFGKVDFINVQVMTPFLIGDKAVELLSSLDEISQEYAIPAYIETHRGTITQDLIRTVEYVNKLNNPKLTIDLSHYVLAGEMLNIPDEAEEMIQQLLLRTKSIHARVSNGQQIQVEVPDSNELDSEYQMLDRFQKWWLKGMQNWHENGNEELFPFICELGPPPYAMTMKNTKSNNIETSDRWTQSLIFAKIARNLWSKI